MTTASLQRCLAQTSMSSSTVRGRNLLESHTRLRRDLARMTLFSNNADPSSEVLKTRMAAAAEIRIYLESHFPVIGLQSAHRHHGETPDLWK
jgi:hypothetical protein